MSKKMTRDVADKEKVALLSKEVQRLKKQGTAQEEELNDSHLEIESYKRQVSELEELVVLMSDSALQTLEDPKKHLQNITKSLSKFDDLLHENFKLKKEMALEKKRFIDLTEAFNDLQEATRLQREEERESLAALENEVGRFSLGEESPTKGGRPDRQVCREWAAQKRQLQETITAISGEVDYLTTKNNEYLTDLRAKEPFYDSYRAALDELNKLREAHGILISMIKNHHIQVKCDGPATQAVRAAVNDNHNRRGFGPKVAQDPNVRINFSHFLTCGVYGNRPLVTEEAQPPISRKRIHASAMITPR